MTKMQTPGVPVRRHLTAHWVIWVAVSVVPLLAYATPLWNNLLADTPIADIIWIPIIALGWMVWNLTLGDTSAPDDAELNAIIGTLLALMVGGLLVLGPERWPAFFVYDHAGLLLWPLWILAMSWLFWGLAGTRRIIIPLIYLLLVWPPIFEGIANATQSILVGWAVGILIAFSHIVNWLTPSSPVGTFSVLYQHHPFLVVVAQACSGADSLLGSAIIIPTLWFLFKGPLRNKLWLSIIALVGALVLNWVRLAIIVFAVHAIGPDITFTYIHPVLGFVLFALLAVGIVLLLRPFHLQPPSQKSLKTQLQPPGWVRITISVAVSGLALTLLWPLFSVPRGSFGNPAPVATFNIKHFLPALSQFAKSKVYYANESSVLGPGSATQADMYTLQSGGSGQALLELWNTPSAGALATYGFTACLLYHGDNFAAVKSFQLEPGVVATAYAVTLPANTVGGPRSTYIDVEWSSAIRVHGTTQYMRWSLAAFPQSAPSLPALTAHTSSASSLQPLTAIQAMSAPASRGHWSTTTVRTRTILVAIAQNVFRQSLTPGRNV